MGVKTGPKYWEIFRDERRQERIEGISKVLGDELNSGEVVADLCCGRGYLQDLLEDANLEEGVRWFNVDKNRYSNGLAKSQERHPETHNIQSDVTQLPFKDNSLDKVVSLCGVENVRPLDQSLQEIRRVLNEDGAFIHLAEFDASPRPIEDDYERGVEYWDEFISETKLRPDFLILKSRKNIENQGGTKRYRRFHANNMLSDNLEENGFYIREQGSSRISLRAKYRLHYQIAEV